MALPTQQEIRTMDLKALSHELERLENLLQNVRFQHANRALKDVTEIRRVRHAIARIKTQLKSGQS